MTAFAASMAEAQAIGLCWLARQPGLPDINVIRSAVSQLHPLSCGWCEYPPDELMRMLKDSNDRRASSEEARWESLPGRAKREAIRIAQGNDE